MGDTIIEEFSSYGDAQLKNQADEYQKTANNLQALAARARKGQEATLNTRDLKILASDFMSHQLSRGIADCEKAGEALFDAATEIDRLRGVLDEVDALREQLADILSRTAIALRGPEPPLTRWSWHDLPERAAAAITAIDVMQRAAMMACTTEAPIAEVTGAAPHKPETER